jgi:two-component system, OmpR family, sensor histidine kinase KdpD
MAMNKHVGNRWRSIWIRRRDGWGRVAIAAIGGPLLVTLPAALENPVPPTSAAMLYVLVVVLASASEGALAGIVTSLLSSLALNFFFTPPIHTFVVAAPEDLIALVVFLFVSIITGVLFSAVVVQRSRAERREAQTAVLNRFTNRLLSGQDLEPVLHDFGRGLAQLFGATRCEISTVMTDPVTFVADARVRPGDSYEVALKSKLRPIGRMTLTFHEERGQLDQDERGVMEGFAGQLALALESMRLSEEVKSAQLDAETNRLRAALFSGVTHDLKTPLSAITASVTSMLDGSGFTDEQRRDHLETIQHEAEHLNRVLSNLLDLSRLRSGALTPDKAPAAIDELIEAVIARLRPQLRGRDVELKLKNDFPEVPMDLVQVDRVLTNLIENAVKFSPANSPIDISAVGSGESVRVTVADHGPGIPKEERERMFKPFERGNGNAAGTGLGLAIARAVVLAHGGRMWAQHRPGGGAALTFELPAGPGSLTEDKDGSPSPDR